MKIKLYHSAYSAASRTVLSCLEKVADAIDVHEAANFAALEADNVSAVPCVIVSRDDGSLFARLEGESFAAATVADLCSPLPNPVIEIPRARIVVGALHRFTVRHFDASHTGPLSLTVNDEPVPAQTVTLETDPEPADSEDSVAVRRVEEPSQFESGEAKIDLEFEEPGVYTISAGGIVVQVEVVSAS